MCLLKKMPNLNVVLVLAIILAYSLGAANAAQEYDVEDGDIIKVTISKTDLSRLVIGGEGRLDRVWSRDGYLDLEADVVHGEAFFRAKPGTPNVFSFFVKDDFGNTYTVTALQKHVPSQTILLNPKNSTGKNLPINKNVMPQPMKKTVNSLFRAMFLNENINGYLKEDNNEPVHLWLETMISMKQVYRGRQYRGEVYEISNVSDSPVEFHETEFFDFGESVVAVGLEQHNLKPQSKTRIFVVRREEVL